MLPQKREVWQGEVAMTAIWERLEGIVWETSHFQRKSMFALSLIDERDITPVGMQFLVGTYAHCYITPFAWNYPHLQTAYIHVSTTYHFDFGPTSITTQ